MFDRLPDLKRVLVIVECGNLHAAAERLNITQPALTRSVKLLEEHLGAKLFLRHPRGVKLTQFGEHIVNHTKHILRECQVAETELGTLLQGEAGTLKMAAAPVWVSYLLPPAIVAAQKRYPAMQIHLLSMDYADAIPRLRNGDLDVFCGGFASEEMLPSFLTRKRFFQAQMHVISRQDHPILQESPGDLEKLLDYPWLSYQNDWGYLDLAMEHIEARTGRRKSASVFCETIIAALIMIQEGDYLSYLPDNFMRIVPGFNLRTVAVDMPGDTFHSGIIFRRSLEKNHAFQTVAATVDDMIKKKMDPGTQGFSL
ncbi:LysR family transcriptional regulator [Phyllobacterium phragmitis]|nr:LysR family transcriptional regulator [Phyllobacterium phragmitis]